MSNKFDSQYLIKSLQTNSKALSKRKADCSTLSTREVRAFFSSRIDADHMIKRHKGHLRHQSISVSEASFAGSCHTHQPQGHNIQICLNTKSVLRETRSYCKHLLTDHKKSTTVSTSSFFYQKRLSPCLSLTLHSSGSIKGIMKLITETAASWLRTYQGPALPKSHIQHVGWGKEKGKKAS